MKHLIYIIPIILFITGCKQPNSGPKATFTIKGRVLNGTTGVPFGNENISASVHVRTKTGAGEDLGTSRTDANGNFTLNYKQTDITYDYATILIESNFFHLENLKVNKNIDSTFYLSSLGYLKIFLQTNKPLELDTDTLFLGYVNYINNNKIFNIDTFVNTFHGYYKTIRVPMPYINIFWGHGKNNFIYDFNRQGFYRVEKSTNITISGDPYIDSVTINY